MNILLLSAWFPYPPNNGSKIRIYNILRQLSKNHNITLFSFIHDDFREKDVEPLRKYCKEIRTVKGHWFNPKRLKALYGYFSSTPRSLIETYDAGMQNIIDEKINNGQIDLIICSQFSTILYALNCYNIPKIFEEIEISVIKDSINREGLRNKLTLWKLKRFIKKLLLNYDGYTVVSLQERENICNISLSSNCEIIPNGVDLEDYKYDFKKEAKGLIYNGALTYVANFDAMQYFLEKVFPLIKKEIPEIKIKITGRTKGVDIAELQIDQNTELTGYVDDIKPLLINSAVCVVPLRLGGGTRLKILEAMALGTPIVSTNKGAEGIEGLISVNSSTIHDSCLSAVAGSAIHDFHIWIEDDPEKFVKAVIELVNNREFAEQMAINARKLVEKRYGWNSIGEKYEMFIRKVIEKKKNIV